MMLPKTTTPKNTPKTTRPADDPRNGPVILRRTLLAQGFNDRAITRMVKSQSLARVRHGAYTPWAVWEQLDAEGRFGLRGRAVLQQACAPIVLSHVSGLAEFGVPLWGFKLGDVHVTRTDGLAGRRGAGVDQHCGIVRPEDWVVVNGVPVMTPTRLALESITLRNSEASLCVLNHLLHEKLTTPEQLDSQYVSMQSWPDMLGAEILLRLADGKMESIGETRTYWCCFQQHLPMPEPQFEISADGRVVARVDFAWPMLGVFLEFDGLIKYEKLLRPGERPSDVVIREKQREEMICRITGWRCIRVTWADLACPQRLAAKIYDALFPSTTAY